MDRRLSDQAVEYFREVGAKGGRIGGKKRLITMTPAQRSAVARKAAAARWGNKTTPIKQQSPLPLQAGEEGIGQGAAAEQTAEPKPVGELSRRWTAWRFRFANGQNVFRYMSQDPMSGSNIANC